MHPRTGRLLTKPYEAVLVYAMNVLLLIVVVEFVFGELHSKTHVKRAGLQKQFPSSVMLRGRGGNLAYIYSYWVAAEAINLNFTARVNDSLYRALQRSGLKASVLCLSRSLQIVAQKKMVKPLLLKYGKYAGKSTITVGLGFLSSSCVSALLDIIKWRLNLNGLWE